MKIRNLRLSAFIGGFILLSVHAENWAQWRGPAFNGTSPETNLPVTFSKTENIAWTCPLEGESAATPIVFDDRVFVSVQESRSKEIHALCVDRKNGSVRWNKTTGVAGKLASRTKRNTSAAPSAVPDGKL